MSFASYLPSCCPSSSLVLAAVMLAVGVVAFVCFGFVLFHLLKKCSKDSTGKQLLNSENSKHTPPCSDDEAEKTPP